MKSSVSGNSLSPAGCAVHKRRAVVLGVLLLATILTTRGMMLFTGQRYLRSDEAVVGLMAKHIVTRSERPLFLYGQQYGGGHALIAYVAAPLFAVCGRSAILLTGVTVTVSVISVLLLWLILRRCFDEWTALAATALYAFSPPVVYQAFLVNGGAESFCLALVSLLFFLRAYREGRRVMLNSALAGLFCGLAYYAMDYALLYAVVMALLWGVTGRRGKWVCLGIFAAAFLVGCLPLIVYNLTHDFAHLRHMFGGGPVQQVGFAAHFFGALRDAVAGDLAAFFSGEIDDFRPTAVGAGSRLHAVVAIAAVLVLLYEHRKAFTDAARNFSLRGSENAALPAATLPLVFIMIYMAIYSSARFSLPLFRTPRYFLPLCPFVSVAIALFCLWQRRGVARKAGLALILVLVARGLYTSTEFGLRQWHEEHRIATSGKAVAGLARELEKKNIRLALAPYEIQWRLMFETDERVLVSCEGISLLARYPWYEREVHRRIEGGEPFALIFRRDEAFLNLARGGQRERSDSDDFVVLFPLTRSHLERLGASEGAAVRIR